MTFSPCHVLAGLAVILPCGAAAEIPLKVGPTGHPVAPVEIDGQPAEFVIDTGAEGSAVYADFAAKRNLPREANAEELQGQTGAAALPIRTIATLTIDGRVAGPLHAVELPRRPGPEALSGIVGLDAIGDRLIDIDVPSGRLALLTGKRRGRLVAHLGAPVQARRLTGGLLAIPVTIGAVAGWAVLDTGARETRINTRFAAAARLTVSDRGEPLRGATQSAMTQKKAVAPQLGVLGKSFRDATVQVIDLPVFEVFGIDDGPAMLLGIDLIRRHRLVIDFPTGRVWLR